MKKIDAIKARIRALREMTPARGCTEAEAAAAAEKVRELMATYGLDEAGIETADSAPIALTNVRNGWPYCEVWSTIARICRAEIRGDWIHDGRAFRPRLIYRAAEPDMLLAEYLHEVLDRAMDRAQADFRKTKGWRLKRSRKTRDAAMTAFMDGFCWSLRGLLTRVFAERWAATEPPPAPPVTKVETSAARKPLSKADKARRKKFDARWNHPARWAGHEAAEKVELHHAMDGEAPAAPKLLGKTG